MPLKYEQAGLVRLFVHAVLIWLANSNFNNAQYPEHHQKHTSKEEVQNMGKAKPVDVLVNAHLPCVFLDLCFQAEDQSRDQF